MKPDNASTQESAPAPAEAEAPVLEQSAAAPESGTSEPNSGTPDAGEPKTMLEAISQGLDKGRADAEGKDETAEPKAEGEEPAPAEKAEPKADKAKKEGDKPEGEEDDFAPPENLTPRSEGRFKKLVDRTKHAEAKFGEINERWTALETVFKDNGIQQEQFESAVSYIGALNRGDIQAARQMLEAELKAIALLSGEEIKVGDPLDDFQDLKQSVDGLEMPRDRALELARYRMQNGYQQQQTRQQEQVQQQSQQWEQQKAAAIKDIDKFVKDREANDLDYRVKGPIMQANVIKWCEGLPPAQWPAQIQRMYEAIGMGARQSPAAGSGAPTPRPLRGGGMGAGAKPAPRSMHEAMWGPASNA